MYYTSFSQADLSRSVSPALQSLMKGKGNNHTFQVLIAVKDNKWLDKDPEVRVLSTYANTALVQVSGFKLQQLIEEDKIQFADIRRKAKEELTTGAYDLTLNKINLAHHSFAEINGNPINISIKEQRFDTNDIDIKNRFFESGIAAKTQFTHASIMATIIAGGGNSSPYAKGVARGALVTSSDFANLLPDPDSVFSRLKISVQNHSYGTGIENYYGADAVAYDLSAKNNPELVYVFSSGNSGNSSPSSGYYSGLPNVANLTGSFKMAKNIITVGAADSFNIVVDQSSRGPAYDGRVKPDLVAFGVDGTSGAAALVSGSAALLQHSYMLDNNSLLPVSDLIKAVLINSADKINNIPLSYLSGYGSLNTYNAIKTIKEHRYLRDSVHQKEEKAYSIIIPSGISKARLTLTWNDVPAIAGSSRALVNDLDLTLQNPASGELWRPWVLNAENNKDSLLLLPQRKTDTLNNTEQITLDDPLPGNYLIKIRGTSLFSADAQSFSIAWQLDSARYFKWSYPTSDDPIPAGRYSILRWQSNVTGNASLVYSFDGLTWNTVSSNVALQDHQFKWSVPDTTAAVILKVQSDSLIIISDTFIISQSVDLHVGFNCPDSFMLFWNKAGTGPFRLFQLGQKYLEPLSDIMDTMTILQKSSFPSLYYSVAPVINGKAGLKSTTKNYSQQGIECYFHTFYANLLNDSTALLITELSSLYHVSEISFQKLYNNGYRTIRMFTGNNNNSFNYSDTSLLQGVNTYRVQIMLTNGTLIYSGEQTVYYFPHNPVLLYPNPAKHNEPVRIIAANPGVYTIFIYDAYGRLINKTFLSDVYQEIGSLHLTTGIYFVRIKEEGQRGFVQKLVVF
jgi:hypothetical protein